MPSGACCSAADTGLDRVTTVHNGPLGSVREALLPDGITAMAQPYAMTLSGLHGRKRVGDAIAAFSAMAGAAPEWTLAIVGEGPDKAMLRALVSQLGSKGESFLPGVRSTPAPCCAAPRFS